MARTISPTLQALLDLEGIETHTTVRFELQDGTERRFSTTDRTIAAAGGLFDNGLLEAGELSQSISTGPDRIEIKVQNVDKTIGIEAEAELYTRAKTTVGRFFSNADGSLEAWVPLFMGDANPISFDDLSIDIEVISDLVAPGNVIADRNLGPKCSFIYRSPDCGYTGLLPTCSKTRKGPNGCQEHDQIGDDYKFGGFEYPDTQPAEAVRGVPDPPPGYDPCFPAGTRILLPDYSEKPIEEIKVGDIVLAFNRTTRELSPREVLDLYYHPKSADRLVDIDGEVQATPNHKFLSGQGDCFDPIGNLEEGEILQRLGVMTRTGPGFFFDWEIKAKTTIEISDPIDTFNFNVAVDHTYFANRFAVSNRKPIPE